MKKIFRAYNKNIIGIGLQVDGYPLIKHLPTGQYYKFIRVTGKIEKNIRLVCEGPIDKPLESVLGFRL